jgi:iron complex transport system substrate-binding protein
VKTAGSARNRWWLSCWALIIGTLTIVAFGRHASPSTTASGSTRIISLAPSVTETLFAIGAGAEVVGVSQYSDYPLQARRLPKIGSFLTPNIEEIVALRPTLVVGLLTSSDRREIRALQAMGIKTLTVDEGTVAAIEASIAKVGDAVGRQQAAQNVITQIRSSISATENRLAAVPTRRVLMVVGHQPLVAVGAGTYLDELITLAHGRNVADFSTQAWPRLSLEYIVAVGPEVILDGQMGTDPDAPDRFWVRYPIIPAVREQRVFGYPEDPTLHPGPRVAQTLRLLARLIHPDTFASTRQETAQ